ncbi:MULTISPECIES: DMT family transporter [Thalassospira]|uniref:Transporter n=2 Tax=Thalassospira TaxID=168934 RepID=A0A367W164_9PROT|nr:MULTISPECIES: DMT family transporter [Thalassospira]MDG4720233.1 DMT family transporter [Thalassospira sp. FZY0004]RCK33086.1 transporter [Thalassospira profundimaris]
MSETSALRATSATESRLVGVTSALATVFIWAGWLIATRYAMTSNFTAVDIGLLRFVVPFVLLAPIWLRKGIWPKGLSIANGLLMLAGSGAFYTLMVASALQFVPASHVGILLPGVMAVWAVLIAVVMFGERPGNMRLAGYGAVIVGVLSLVALKPAGAVSNDMLMGYGLVSAGAFMWACYTHAMRQSGLGALDAAAFVGFWSFVIMAVIALFTGTTLPDAPVGDIMMLLTAQGVLAGCVAVITYGLAVRHIGSTGASAFGAMTPALTALGGVVLLGEQGGVGLALAVVLVILGVMVASGVFRKVKL